ncbi:gamma-glutamyl-gamma-aminobutyrate hydrolase family protein [Enorma burkinafasonensis]|uniref:gamma-glutamyl-gamma-aminobutyrate hydrolase family protein n=1 Tax=Enorma burkinafasonensis TaxID=2590867 RepID=UPI0026E9D755|nr:gamma-glutamyl-gamma-aminobutyrate hydrolase family protein [Enorma burkinafasonensis]MCI7730868.1 gamma-glutamyl-gamma-aminobutyrate hydrolase family protein [Enorma burkinafasonensis]
MPSKRPLILVTSSATEYLGEPALRLSENYADAVVMAGGLPVVTPLSDDLSIYDDLLDRADGLMLTGGSDIDPARYRDALSLDADELHAGERTVHEVTPGRDAIELYLLEGAERRGMPVLGICRGLQIMNIAHGGSLYHDLPAQHPADHGTLAITHDAYMDGRISHRISLEEGSLIARTVGTAELEVNSLHHQAIRDLAPGFACTARATDGVIEAIEDPSRPYMLGVQWHPEYFAATEPMALIFRSFVGACREQRA